MLCQVYHFKGGKEVCVSQSSQSSLVSLDALFLFSIVKTSSSACL